MLQILRICGDVTEPSDSCEENIKTKQADGWDARVTLMTLFGNILIYLTRMYETKYKSQHRKTLKQIDNSCKFFSKDMLLNRSVSEMSQA